MAYVISGLCSVMVEVMFFMDVAFLSELLTLEAEGVHSFQTLGINYPLMCCHILEEQNLFNWAVLLKIVFSFLFCAL
jgi:hypothetical protein